MGEKVIIFDFDGTIADSFPVILDIINKFAKEEGVEKFSKQKILELRDFSASQIFSQLKISKIKIPIFIEKFRKEFNNRIQLLKPIDGIESSIQSLKEDGKILGIVTSNSADNVRQFLKNNNLDVFDFVYSDKSVFGKDKILKRLLVNHNFESRDIMYVGDEVRDIEAAKKAGIKITAVSWGFNSKKALIKNSPDYLIDSPDDLVSVK